MRGSSNRKVDVTVTEIALILIIRMLASFQTIFHVLVFTELPPLVFNFATPMYSVPPIKDQRLLCVCSQSHYLMSSNTFWQFNLKIFYQYALCVFIVFCR